MSDSLYFYLDMSSCNIEDCDYVDDIECYKCIKKRIEEHDKQIRADAIERCKDIVKIDCTQECAEGYDCIKCLCNQFEQLKEQK